MQLENNSARVFQVVTHSVKSEVLAKDHSNKEHLDLVREADFDFIEKKTDEYLALGKKILIKSVEQNPSLFTEVQKMNFSWYNHSKVTLDMKKLASKVSTQPGEAPQSWATVMLTGLVMISPGFAFLMSVGACAETDQNEISYPEYCATIDEEVAWNELQLKRKAYEFLYKDINQDFAKGLIHFYDLVLDQEAIQVACAIGSPDFAIAGTCTIRVLMDAGVNRFDDCDHLDELNDMYGEANVWGDCSPALQCIELERHPIVEFSYAVRGKDAFGELVEKWCYHTLRVSAPLTESASKEAQPLSDEFIAEYLEQAEYVDWEECESIEGGCRDHDELNPSNAIERDEACQLRWP